MKGDFVKAMSGLIEQTPNRVSGRVEVDQVYAHYQHAHPEFKHPDGGQAFYLQEPLYVRIDGYLARIAEGAISSHGVNFTDAMSENMEDLSQAVYDKAPWEFGDLRASGHPVVEEDGEVTYDRPPLCPRLSKEELRIKGHLRYLYDPHRYR